jgi:hypothetical protein
VNLSYSSLDDDNSIYEKTYTGSSNVSLIIKDVALTHQITNTSLADTTSAQ